MRLTEVLGTGGRQLAIAGLISLAIGLLVVPFQAWLSQAAVPWGELGAIAAMALAVTAAVHGYQRLVRWKKLRGDLLAAPVESAAPSGALPRPKIWVWLLWGGFMFVMAYGFHPAFAIFSGSLLAGYGSAGPWLAGNVSGVEAGRVTFYTRQDPKTRRPSVYRVVRDEALDGA
ncbi:MAG TPA: hypothetical protein VGE07_00190 [Herpetosiphonaceae bacterium]